MGVFFFSVAPVITILKFFKSNAIIVKKGAAIDIPAEVKGLPLPTVQWMKDGVVIEKPDEEKMTMETEEVRIHSCAHLLHSFIMSFIFALGLSGYCNDVCGRNNKFLIILSKFIDKTFGSSAQLNSSNAVWRPHDFVAYGTIRTKLIFFFNVELIKEFVYR